MLGRKSNKKIEPRFDAPARRASGDIHVDRDDRVIEPAPARTRRKAAKEPQRAASRKRSRKDGRAKSGRGGGRGGSGSGRTTGRFRLLRRLAYWCFVLGIWGGIGVACIVGFYAAQLPQMSSWSVPARPPNARIVSVDGELIANRGTSDGKTGGEAIRLDEMSPYLPKAIIAIEDKRFKNHFGIDPIGLTRAMAINLISGHLVQGGSTLTQQLAKNLFLEPERTIGRKIQEAVLAMWLETRFSKDEILELYLNRVYFGSGAYGVDAAARRYFNKSARDLTLGEAALLAGLVKAPSRLSPARDPKAAQARAQVVLAAMLDQNFITDKEAAKAMTMKPERAKRYWSGSQHYAADMVTEQLPDLIGKVPGDVIVETTIDLDLQKAGEYAIHEAIDENGEKSTVSQGALIALDGTGAIRALIGGYEYANSQFNRAVDAKRQPGSAFKPIVYLTALEAGRTPESVRQDAPVKIGDWTPENYDREYRGPVTLREALALSLNSVAAQMVMEVGPKRVTETAQRLGIESKIERNASIALGTSEVSLMELTAAYGAFANGGYRVTPFLITRVTTADGKILYRRNAAPPPRVVDQNELGMMNDMLAEVVRSGTGKAARIDGWPAAGKTGTTQNSRDALFVGYTSNLVAGVWFGNDDGTPMKRVTGGTLPARAWASFMGAAHKGVPIASLPGNYLPRAAPIPIARPGADVAERSRPRAVQPQPVARGNSIDTSVTGVTGAPMPAQEVGGTPRRRSLFDVLFGDSRS